MHRDSRLLTSPYIIPEMAARLRSYAAVCVISSVTFEIAYVPVDKAAQGLVSSASASSSSSNIHLGVVIVVMDVSVAVQDDRPVSVSVTSYPVTSDTWTVSAPDNKVDVRTVKAGVTVADSSSVTSVFSSTGTRGVVKTVSSVIAVVCSAEFSESTVDSSSVVTALGRTYCEHASVVCNSCSPVVSLVSVDDLSASGFKLSAPVFVS